MARNEEKQYGRLNRMILQREREEYNKLHPKRPRLETLNSVNEIKEWLPSIKKDIDFNLKQSQVVCYSDQKIAEFHQNVVRFEKEYKMFVRKMMNLDPSLSSVPWTDRPYERKRPKVEEMTDGLEGSILSKDVRHIRIETPILDGEVKSDISEMSVTDDNNRELFSGELQDEPLQFNTVDVTVKKQKSRCFSTTKLKCFDKSRSYSESLLAPFDVSSNDKQRTNILNLNYSSSSESEG